MDADISAETGAESSLLQTATGAAGILRSLVGLGSGKLAALGVVAASMLGLLTLFVWQTNRQNLALLYGNLELRESSQIVELLDKAHIPYEVDDGGGRVLVPADTVSKARMLLARDGLPTGGTVGYELFDHADPLTMTQFQQSLDETRALEGELERTIRGMSGVRAVRVHLVLPTREPFEHDTRPAQASILLTMAPAAHFDQEGIQAVLNLTAAAVPGLRPENISLVDTSGALLARAGRPANGLASAETIEELRRQTEDRIAQNVEDLLQQVVGVGHVRVEANVDLDTQQVKETQESYNPDQQVARSERTTEEKTHTTEAPTAVTVQNNLPNADAGGGAGGSQSDRQEDTRNYEIGRTVRTWQRDTPQIRRLSVAVMVDGESRPGIAGKPEWHERSTEDLRHIQSLVRTAVGYDEKRGDDVEVINMRFNQIDELPQRETSLLLGVDRADLMHFATNGMVGLLVILSLLFVVRPLVLRLNGGPSGLLVPGQEQALGADGAKSKNEATGGAGGIGTASGRVQLEGQVNQDDSLLEMSNVEGQVRASSIRRTAQLADKHPEETLSILRAWMAQSEAI